MPAPENTPMTKKGVHSGGAIPARVFIRALIPALHLRDLGLRRPCQRVDPLNIGHVPDMGSGHIDVYERRNILIYIDA